MSDEIEAGPETVSTGCKVQCEAEWVRVTAQNHMELREICDERWGGECHKLTMFRGRLLVTLEALE